MCRKHDVQMVVGMLERSEGRLYDSALFINECGDILLKYRRINPQWHSPQAPDQYAEGADLTTAPSRLGTIALVICGDMFDAAVVEKIEAADPDYLLVPMSRSYSRYTPQWWNNEEKGFYTRQVGHIGIPALLVNSFETGARWPAFGGAMIVASDGQILEETPTGEPSMLVTELAAHT
jgi:predicted amidohydrolase